MDVAVLDPRQGEQASLGIWPCQEDTARCLDTLGRCAAASHSALQAEATPRAPLTWGAAGTQMWFPSLCQDSFESNARTACGWQGSDINGLSFYGFPCLPGCLHGQLGKDNLMLKELIAFAKWAQYTL